MAAELFYIRNRDGLYPPKEFIDVHERIMSGERVRGWPSKKDIEDRMWVVKKDEGSFR